MNEIKLPADKDSVIARYMDGPALLERALDGIIEDAFDKMMCARNDGGDRVYG